MLNFLLSQYQERKKTNSYCIEYFSVVQTKNVNGVSCKCFHGNNEMLKILNKNKLVFQMNADAVYENRIRRITTKLRGPDNANGSVKWDV